MKPNVHAGRLERRVRRVGRATMPWCSGFCSLPLVFIRRNTRDTVIAPYGLISRSISHFELPVWQRRLNRVPDR